MGAHAAWLQSTEFAAFNLVLLCPAGVYPKPRQAAHTGIHEVAGRGAWLELHFAL